MGRHDEAEQQDQDGEEDAFHTGPGVQKTARERPCGQHRYRHSAPQAREPGRSAAEEPGRAR